MQERSRNLPNPRLPLTLFDAPPILRTPSVVDYDFADIGGRRYLLPRRADVRVVTRQGQSRNVLEFTNYRKFSGESPVTFEKP